MADWISTYGTSIRPCRTMEHVPKGAGADAGGGHNSQEFARMLAAASVIALTQGHLRRFSKPKIMPLALMQQSAQNTAPLPSYFEHAACHSSYSLHGRWRTARPRTCRTPSHGRMWDGPWQGWAARCCMGAEGTQPQIRVTEDRQWGG